MNWKLIGMVTLEVLAAIGTGVAVFVSINKECGSDSNNSNNGNNKQNNGPHKEPNGTFCPGNNQVTNSNNTQQVVDVRNESKIISGLRATQNTCGKIFTLVQTATQVAECVSRIFGKNSEQQIPYYNQQWMYGGGGGYGCYGSGGGGTLTRITPFIIEANGCPSQQRYPF